MKKIIIYTILTGLVLSSCGQVDKSTASTAQAQERSEVPADHSGEPMPEYVIYTDDTKECHLGYEVRDEKIIAEIMDYYWRVVDNYEPAKEPYESEEPVIGGDRIIEIPGYKTISYTGRSYFTIGTDRYYDVHEKNTIVNDIYDYIREQYIKENGSPELPTDEE